MSESLRRRKVVESTAIAGAIGGISPCTPTARCSGRLARSMTTGPAASGSTRPRRRFECRDCGASGDVVDFVRLYEGITVSEALDMLEA